MSKLGEDLEGAIRSAVKNAIREMGIGNFKKTSIFISAYNITEAEADLRAYEVLRDDCAFLRSENDRLTRERDEARRVRDETFELRHLMESELEVRTKERDEARASTERLAEDVNRHLYLIEDLIRERDVALAKVERMDAALAKAIPRLEENARWHRDMQSHSSNVIAAFEALDAARAARKDQP